MHRLAWQRHGTEWQRYIIHPPQNHPYKMSSATHTDTSTHKPNTHTVSALSQNTISTKALPDIHVFSIWGTIDIVGIISGPSGGIDSGEEITGSQRGYTDNEVEGWEKHHPFISRCLINCNLYLTHTMTVWDPHTHHHHTVPYGSILGISHSQQQAANLYAPNRRLMTELYQWIFIIRCPSRPHGLGMISRSAWWRWCKDKDVCIGASGGRRHTTLL